MTQVRKNQEVARPVWNKTKEGHTHTVTTNNEIMGYKEGDNVFIKKDQYVDYEGNPLTRSQRVPEYDKKTGRFNVKTYGWEFFVTDAEEMNTEKAQELGRPLTDHEKILPEEAYLRASLETNAAQAKGWALYYNDRFEASQKNLPKLRKALKLYNEVEANIPESEKWKLARQVMERQAPGAEFIPSEYKQPSELIQDAIKEAERLIEQSREASASQESQAREALESMEHIQSARKYALGESHRSYAEAGLYAYDETTQKGLKKNPLMVTMENIFPESYGGHPEELMDLIEGSRKEMAKMLHDQRGMSMDHAQKTAEKHIKATFDTGHLNMWRKYWETDSSKTVKQNNEDFDGWMINMTEKMAKRGIVGNVHVVDNMGYQDDHLAPGQGNAPVKEMAEVLRKYGYKGAFTVEPGADASTDQGDFWGLMKTWQLFGSPVYSAHAAVRADVPKQSWTDLQYTYFGQGQAPYFVFGGYAPSQDWAFWSEVSME